MIPMMVFVTTLIRNNGRLDYILPFVIFYSFLKIGAFTVSVFGEVNNPFRLAQFASLTVILGSVLILFQKKMLLMLDLGAFLIGFGLSVFVPMYRTIKAIVSERTGERYQKEEFFWLYFNVDFYGLSVCRIRVRRASRLVMLFDSFSHYAVFDQINGQGSVQTYGTFV